MSARPRHRDLHGAISHGQMRRIGHRKPSPKFQGYMTDATALRDHEAMMADGSAELLRSLWYSHQRVMLVAKARGRLVVQP